MTMHREDVWRTPIWLLFAGLLILFLAACDEAGAVDYALTPATEPALKAASTLLDDLQVFQPLPSPTSPLIIPLATGTPRIVYPPTATPVMLPLSPGQPDPAAAAAVQAIQPVPAVETDSTQGAPAGFEEAFPAEGLDCQAVIEAYQADLTTDLALVAYEAPTVATCYLEMGDRPAALAVYEAAIAAGADRVTEVALRLSLARILAEEGNYPAALAQYEAILAVAETDQTRGQVMYLAGQAELSAGNSEAGYDRYLALVSTYPAASQSYQALSELIAAGYTVDDYQQGLVAYNARTYDLAAAAFQRAVTANPEQNKEGFLYLAWSLEKLGLLDEALAHLDSYSAAGDLAEAANGQFERAEMQARAGRLQAALDDYQVYLARYPQSEQAPDAFWQSAALSEKLGFLTISIERYQAFAGAYPDHWQAAEALFQAGYIAWRLGQDAGALSIWQQGASRYPEREYGAASLLWLLKQDAGAAANPLTRLALNNANQSYYGLRARHVAGGVAPFGPAGPANLAAGEIGRDEAENWLRQWLGLSTQTPVGVVSGALANDPRLKRAEKLWSMGQRGEATRQYEALRIAYASDPLASYQLALTFRDLGLYRSSILAAISVMSLAGVNASGAPRFIARLAYPAYYTDLVSAEAQRYGLDPLLLLALIREESYFDPWATSAAGALGLSQILPETGAFIAQQLGRPGFQAGDLGQPAVNIAFGAYFLDRQLDAFGGNVAAALAAYNAGAGPAARWVGQAAQDHDLFLETVDFAETQRYIKQIYTVQAIYRFLYS